MKFLQTITNAIDWLEGLFHKEYGIRVFYTLLMLIPAVSIYVLYRTAVNRGDSLLLQLEQANKNYVECLETKSNLKNEIRKEVHTEIMGEFRGVYDEIHKFQMEVLLENRSTIDKIKQYESKLNDYE